MTDPALSEERAALLDAADRYARERLYPLARRMDDEEWWPDAEFRALGSAGYLALTAPPELGGAGLDVFATGLVAQAFGRWNHALALSWIAHENLCLHNILRNGSDEQRRRFAPGLASGASIGCLALTEPGAGSDALGSMATRAYRDGDLYRISGRKLYITNGPVADLALLYAKTDPERGARGISAFVVDLKAPGVRVAQKLVKMGFRGSPTAELAFDDTPVRAADRLGAEGEGVRCLMSGLDLERATLAPLCLGIAERALELALGHARSRRQFGRPIAEFQMIQARLADIWVDVDAMRAYAYRCLEAVNGMGRSEGGRGSLHKLAAASILFCADALHRVLDHAAQIHGGAAYIWETEMNRLYRAIKLLEIGAGTSEVRKLIISEELLRAQPGS